MSPVVLIQHPVTTIKRWFQAGWPVGCYVSDTGHCKDMGVGCWGQEHRWASSVRTD